MHDDRRDTQTLTTERAIPERGVEKYRCASVRRAREEETATGTAGWWARQRHDNVHPALGGVGVRVRRDVRIRWGDG